MVRVRRGGWGGEAREGSATSALLVLAFELHFLKDIRKKRLILLLSLSLSVTSVAGGLFYGRERLVLHKLD
jgi:hypothetical protein